MYDTLQTIHVIAAVAWVGGGIFHVFASAQLAGSPPEMMRRWGEVGAAAGQRFYGPAAVVTLLAGIGMVLASQGGVSWSDPFISIGFAAVALSFVLGAVLTERASRELTEEASSASPDPARLAALSARVRLLSMLDVAVLLVAVWAMVVRPGG